MRDQEPGVASGWGRRDQSPHARVLPLRLCFTLCPVALLHPPGLSILLSLVPQGKKTGTPPPNPNRASLKSKFQGKDFLKGVTLLASSLLPRHYRGPQMLFFFAQFPHVPGVVILRKQETRHQGSQPRVMDIQKGDTHRARKECAT